MLRATGRRAALVFTLLVGIASVSASASAGEPTEGGSAAAESLFQDARRLMDAKKYGEACPKFLASQKLSPAIGTLLNLADCYEKNGQLASAWARFHEAIALAQRLNRPQRESTARERADKLEPRLLKLTIVSRAGKAEVKLDDNVLDPAVLGSPVPVDPGKHVVEASAKGKKTWSSSIEVSERAKASSLEIPPLEDDPNQADAKPVASPPFTPPPEEKPSSGSAQKTLGIVALGVGVVGLGVGTFFGLRTSSKWDEAKGHCIGLECDEEGVVLATTAKNAGLVSTISFIAGGAFLAGGAILFFTAPSRPSTNAAKREPLKIGLGPGSVILGGRF